MAGRRLGAEERALWARVIESVNPLAPRPSAPKAWPPAPTPRPPPTPVVIRPIQSPAAKSSNTLDGSWDRKLGNGLIHVDMTVDLHGHTLQSAHRLLDSSLERAIAGQARVLLLITGKPPRPEAGDAPKRGAIRAAVGDWIAFSRHASSIAAVRNAHPRHGGVGALYIILKRIRSSVSTIR